ncbi:MAG TPA: hypothetical protein EYP41_15915 [Anaerolineae bacterium]|nr:hypothetical protein [Anaerolineae bacterium]HIP73052.1 hypothetical protein [Anaerolineae bacterium]
MYPTISLGPLSLPTAGIVYLLGAWLCLSVIERAAKKLDAPVEATYGAAVTALAAGAVGARLTFVFQYWPAFQENLLSIVWPLNNGFNVAGGLVIGGIAAFFYGRYKQLHWPQTLDALIPGIVLGLMVVSLADFLAGPGYGVLTRTPFGVSQFGIRRHAVQIYEIIVGGAALLVWWKMVGRRQYPGQLFLITSVVYAAGRLFTDYFRDNPWVTAGGYHIVQIISLGIVLAGIFLLGYFQETGKQELAEE